VVPQQRFVQVQFGGSILAATFPHPSLRATLPTRGRERRRKERISRPEFIAR
jgi:hypothetical protein